jgi:hypothetical protein
MLEAAGDPRRQRWLDQMREVRQAPELIDLLAAIPRLFLHSPHHVLDHLDLDLLNFEEMRPLVMDQLV